MASRPGDPGGSRPRHAAPPPGPSLRHMAPLPGHAAPPSGSSLQHVAQSPRQMASPRHMEPPPRQCPPRTGSLAGDILIGGKLAGQGGSLDSSTDPASPVGWDQDVNDTGTFEQAEGLPSECPFCGAPVVSSVCGYCGRSV